MGSFSSEHGLLKLCLVRDYPDAFYFSNKIALWGFYALGFSVIIFIWVLIDAFLPKSRIRKKKKVFIVFYKNRQILI